MTTSVGETVPDTPGALQAQVLHGALPYLQRVCGKTFVVVCEGAVLADGALRSSLGADVALLHLVGVRIVLVHGGAGLALSALTHAHENLLGLVNHHGCHAVGLTAADGGPDGLAGRLIQRLHSKGFVPVVDPVVEAHSGDYIATDSNELACDMAVALDAERRCSSSPTRQACSIATDV
jgi:acetylglutamate kinase